MSISSRSIVKVLTLTLLFVGAVYVAYLIRRELIWIGSALFLAIALNPAVDGLTRYMPRRSRNLAVGAVFLILVSVLTAVLAVFVPPLITQTELLIHNLPHYTEQLTNGSGWVSDQIRTYNLVDRVRQSQDQVLNYLSSAGGSFFVVLRDVFSGFAATMTVLGLTFFMLLEGPAWLEAIWRLIQPKHRTRIRILASEMYGAVSGYVTGNVFTSLLAAASTSIVLMLVGVPYAIPLGIAVGLFDLLPLVGATIGAAIVLVVSLFTSWGAALWMLGFFTVYQQIENHVLQPLVYGRTVKMSPLTVLVSVIIGAGLGGILGALVAIPIGASVQIILRDVTQPTRRPNHT